MPMKRESWDLMPSATSLVSNSLISEGLGSTAAIRSANKVVSVFWLKLTVENVRDTSVAGLNADEPLPELSIRQPLSVSKIRETAAKRQECLISCGPGVRKSL